MIKVFIHGRPQGQDIWSAAPVANDKFYLNPFLDSRIGENMNSVLQIDVWQNNAYYSYIHRKSVIEYGNRPGAYFAITICFEKHLCTQVALLYGLLESVYKQLCLTNLLEVNGEQEHFLISQFSEKENVVNQISTVILQNVNKYIASTLKPLNTSVDTTKTQYKTYANVDVDSPQFLSDCTTCRLLVAPSIVSKDKLPAELKQKISIIENEKDKLAEDRNSWQSKAEHESAENRRLLEDKGQLQAQISALQQQVDTIKEEQKKAFEKQISDLQKSIDEQKQQSAKLSRELEEEKKQKQGLQQELNKSKQTQNNLEQELTKAKQKKKESKNGPAVSTSVPATSQSQDVPFLESIASMDIQNLLHNIMKELRRMAGRFPVAERYITMGASLLSCIMLLGAFIFYYMGTPKINLVDHPLESSKDTVIVYESLPQIPLPYTTNAKINIQGYSGGNLKQDTQYILELKGLQNFYDYQWIIKGNGELVNQNLLRVIGEGEIEILCVDSHNYIIKSRKLNAQ